jgi:hypothetical protein
LLASIIPSLNYCDGLRPEVKLQFCANTAWKDCIASVISPNRYVSTNRLNDVASIAVGLGLCCQFYRYVHSFLKSAFIALPTYLPPRDRHDTDPIRA